MLPAAYRMRRGSDFERAVRRGRRVGRRTLVMHGAAVDSGAPAPGEDVTSPALVGFVVSRAVGPAVVRNRVKRRLRALVADRVGQLPAGLLLVVRANPAASTASGTALAADVDAALPRLLRAIDAVPVGSGAPS